MLASRKAVFLSSLKSKKVTELKELASNCGVMSSGVKPEIIDRLAEHFSKAADHKSSNSVISFDLGHRNLAFCHVDKNSNVLDWALVDLELPSFHPSVVAPIVREFVKTKIVPNLEKADAVLFEQQRARSGGSHGIFEQTLRVNCVEAILWTSLFEAREKLGRDITMLPINRSKIDKSWETELDNVVLKNKEVFAKIKKKTYYKKQATSLLVDNWLNKNETVICSDDFKAMFRAAKKKDDLSDCLLQALTWFRWQTFSENFANQELLKELKL